MPQDMCPHANGFLIYNSPVLYLKPQTCHLTAIQLNGLEETLEKNKSGETLRKNDNTDKTNRHLPSASGTAL